MGAAGASQGDAGVKRQTILLVDDEEDIRESLQQLIEASLEGVDVVVAASGQEALDVVEGRSVDLIVSDYKMPGMNGLELLSRIGRTRPHIPRILVTAFPDLEIAIRAINEAGIENFFTKPFDPDQVLNVVRALLYEQRAQELRNRSFARSIDLLRKSMDQK
ncbi:MAG TPA: response regulator [Candidatus Thermoplasmatota archaeon]|nr:response regulator [Candidatus Thermoplasmatota archaeon]